MREGAGHDPKRDLAEVEMARTLTFIGGLLLVGVAALLTTTPPSVHAQAVADIEAGEGAPEDEAPCAQWQVLSVVVNTDGGQPAATLDEPVALGWPQPFATGVLGLHAVPQSIEDAIVDLPEGFEPFAASGGSILLRRCAG